MSPLPFTSYLLFFFTIISGKFLQSKNVSFPKITFILTYLRTMLFFFEDVTSQKYIHYQPNLFIKKSQSFYLTIVNKVFGFFQASKP